MRIITPRGKRDEAGLAAGFTGPILETLEAYFDIAYPYAKLDQISVPSGFGAMENPGLITYGHRRILVPKGEETPDRQRSFASVCAHELAHQWFGNLVTMAWWNDIWLNEAFASWVGIKALKAWKPDWGLELNRVSELNQALRADALVSARRIRQPIESVDDIANAFDTITYQKGSAVIAMFENLVGVEAFRKGVHRYLVEHSGGNGTSEDFIAAVAAASKSEVTESFNTMLDQPGAPVLSVGLVCAKGAKPKLTFAQSRYLPLGSTGEQKQTWQLPVCVRYSVAGTQERLCTLLTASEGEQVLNGASRCPDWVLPNDGMHGYYRGRLGGQTSSVKLIKAAWAKLTEPERLGVLGDLQAEVDAGQLSLEEALSVVPLAAVQTNYRLAGAAIRLVSLIDRRKLVAPSQRAQYEAYVRSVFGPRAKQAGLSVGPKDDENARLLRPELLGMVGGDGNDKAVQGQALPLAKAWVQHRKGIDPELVSVVMGIAARTGDVEFHVQLQRALLAEKDPAQRNYLLWALGDFSEPSLVKAHLALTLDPSLTVTEAMGLLGAAAQNQRTEDVAFEFLKTNWEAVVKRMPHDWAGYLATVADGFCDAEHRGAAKEFFDGRTTAFPGGPRIFAGTMEKIELCMKYRERHQSSATAFLQKQPGND